MKNLRNDFAEGIQGLLSMDSQLPISDSKKPGKVSKNEFVKLLRVLTVQIDKVIELTRPDITFIIKRDFNGSLFKKLRSSLQFEKKKMKKH